jgi:membrane dipeptidase
VDEMVAHHGLRRALSAADLEAAHAAGQPLIVADVEGLDFPRESSSGSSRRISEASGTFSSSTIHPMTSATSRRASSRIRGSPRTGPR